MFIRRSVVSLAALLLCLGMHSVRAEGNSNKDGAARCLALANVDFSNIEDAPTRLESSESVAADGAKPAYCRVRGYIWPQVGFEVQLPLEHWNNKFIEIGHGGFGGTLNMTFWCALDRGYACIVSNLGHTGDASDGLWARNNLQAQIDFGFRGAHVAAVAGKAITQRFYGRAPAHSYFHGCSTGGQQALSEAQRFPWDFDGIIAGAPSPTFSGPMMNYLWAARALVGTVTRSDLKLVHERALERCDMDDGVKDGVIGNPLQCAFDVAELRCRQGQKSSCLTEAQVQAIKKVYSGPSTSSGEKIYSGGPLLGSELNWITDEMSTAYVIDGNPAPWPQEYFANIGFMPAPGSRWRPNEFDFDRDYQRLRSSESIFGAADNPDLRKFNGAGGKLILYQGLQDESDIPSDSIDYYQTAEKVMGGHEATQAFFRLFLVPGMNHCIGGEGPSAIDYLSYLEHWVERGEAPEKMIGAHVVDSYWDDPHLSRILTFPLDPTIPIAFTRPLYPYPAHSHYQGTGSTNDAASFVPIKSP